MGQASPGKVTADTGESTRARRGNLNNKKLMGRGERRKRQKVFISCIDSRGKTSD